MSLLRVLEQYLEWLCKMPYAALVFYKVVKMIGEIYAADFDGVRVRYEKIALRIWQQKKEECQTAGCELVRTIQNVSKNPVSSALPNVPQALEPILKELAAIAPNGRPVFWNMLNSPLHKTGNNDFLNLSIPPAVERKLVHILLSTQRSTIAFSLTWILREYGIEKVVSGSVPKARRGPKSSCCWWPIGSATSL